MRSRYMAIDGAAWDCPKRLDDPWTSRDELITRFSPAVSRRSPASGIRSGRDRARGILIERNKYGSATTAGSRQRRC